ncbi:MAG: T9SS type A sorting domain-containing protein [Bacteroidota bacterium]
MKTIYIFLLVVILSFLTGFQVFSQISYGGKPWTYEHKNPDTEIDHIQLRGPDMVQLRKKAIQNEENGLPPVIGKLIDVDINMDNAGSWDILKDGRRLWRLKITSENAQALSLIYEAFDLPHGSRLFIYSPDKVQTLGAYNHKNIASGTYFSTEMIYGESLILEYISPRPRQIDGIANKEFVNKAEINIKHVNYIFRYAPDPYRETKDFGASDPCQVNINCSEGDNWQNQKKGVARILYYDGSYSYYCTGTLVNNTNEDGTPYFLSAYHCGGDVSTSYYSSWNYYFNYESSGCSNGISEPSPNTITGCDYISSAPLDGGSDFLLVELNQTPPSNYNVVYNGWDRSTVSSGNGVSIHHPSGDIKKISTYVSSLQTDTYNESVGASNAHWRVYWSETNNGHGVTEAGSSGSPIFNSDGFVTGTLSGGTAACDNTGGYDLYGKFSYHWDNNGSSNDDKLQPWLDPAGTGTTSLNFYDPDNTGVNADFTANTQSITEGETVSFTSTSSGFVDSYNWTFDGGTPSSSTDENPVITYNTAGTYDVSLSVSGGGDSDSHTETNYITANPQEGTGEDCTWLNEPLTGTPTVYLTDGESGYISGNNSFGDLAKSNYFEHTGTGYVFNLGFDLAHAEGTSSTIEIAVWDEVGGSPGTTLASREIAMSTITNNFSEQGDYFEFSFDDPVEVDGDFFAGIVLPQDGDIIALMTNTDGDVSPGTAWEEWDDGSWYPYYDENSWEGGINVDHAIYPEVCASINDMIEDKTTRPVQVYPNPTNGTIKLSTKTGLTDASLTIYNSLGKKIKERNITNTKQIEINLRNNPQGLYFINIRSEEGNFTEKVQLIK